MIIALRRGLDYVSTGIYDATSKKADGSARFNVATDYVVKYQLSNITGDTAIYKNPVRLVAGTTSTYCVQHDDGTIYALDGYSPYKKTYRADQPDYYPTYTPAVNVDPATAYTGVAAQYGPTSVYCSQEFAVTQIWKAKTNGNTIHRFAYTNLIDANGGTTGCNNTRHTFFPEYFVKPVGYTSQYTPVGTTALAVSNYYTSSTGVQTPFTYFYFDSANGIPVEFGGQTVFPDKSTMDVMHNPTGVMESYAYHQLFVQGEKATFINATPGPGTNSPQPLNTWGNCTVVTIPGRDSGIGGVGSNKATGGAFPAMPIFESSSTLEWNMPVAFDATQTYSGPLYGGSNSSFGTVNGFLPLSICDLGLLLVSAVDGMYADASGKRYDYIELCNPLSDPSMASSYYNHLTGYPCNSVFGPISALSGTGSNAVYFAPGRVSCYMPGYFGTPEPYTPVSPALTYRISPYVMPASKQLYNVAPVAGQASNVLQTYNLTKIAIPTVSLPTSNPTTVSFIQPAPALSTSNILYKGVDYVPTGIYNKGLFVNDLVVKCTINGVTAKYAVQKIANTGGFCVLYTNPTTGTQSSYILNGYDPFDRYYKGWHAAMYHEVPYQNTATKKNFQMYGFPFRSRIRPVGYSFTPGIDIHSIINGVCAYNAAAVPNPPKFTYTSGGSQVEFTHFSFDDNGVPIEHAGDIFLLSSYNVPITASPKCQNLYYHQLFLQGEKATFYKTTPDTWGNSYADGRATLISLANDLPKFISTAQLNSAYPGNGLGGGYWQSFFNCPGTPLLESSLSLESAFATATYGTVRSQELAGFRTGATMQHKDTCVIQSDSGLYVGKDSLRYDYLQLVSIAGGGYYIPVESMSNTLVMSAITTATNGLLVSRIIDTLTSNDVMSAWGAQIAQAQTTIATAQTATVAAQTALTAANAQNAGYQSAITILSTSLAAEGTQDHKDLTNTSANLNQYVNSLSEISTGLGAQLTQANGVCTALDTSLAGTQSIQTAVQAAFTSAQQCGITDPVGIASITANLATTTTSITQAQTDQATVKGLATAAQDQITGLSASVATIQGTITALTGSIATVQQSIANAVTAQQIAQTALTAAQAITTTSGATLATLTSTLNSANTALATAQASETGLSTQVTSVINQMSQLNTPAIHTSITQIQNALSSTTQNISAIIAAQEQIQGVILTAQQTTLAILNAGLTAAQASQLQMQAQIGTLNDSITSSGSENVVQISGTRVTLNTIGIVAATIVGAIVTIFVGVQLRLFFTQPGPAPQAQEG